jgi:hypothetical protein
MNYAMPVVSHKSEREVHARPLMAPCARRMTAQPAANEEAPGRVDVARAVDPMLLVYQERVETFRLVAAALRRGFQALTRSVAS